jgi:phosphomethylpyrimidine synthase
VAHRIAAHAADVARGLPGARDWDDRMSRARTDFDWKAQMELAMDSTRAKEIRKGSQPDEDFCSMCGEEWCAVRRSREVLAKEKSPEPPQREEAGSEAKETK